MHTKCITTFGSATLASELAVDYPAVLFLEELEVASHDHELI